MTGRRLTSGVMFNRQQNDGMLISCTLRCTVAHNSIAYLERCTKTIDSFFDSSIMASIRTVRISNRTLRLISKGSR
jgi:hypothetical protein